MLLSQIEFPILILLIMLLKNQGHQQTNIDIKIFLSPPTQPLLTDSATNSIMNSANMYLFTT